MLARLSFLARRVSEASTIFVQLERLCGTGYEATQLRSQKLEIRGLKQLAPTVLATATSKNRKSKTRIR